TADAAGNWSYIPVPPLLNGSHELSAKAQDAAGNISPESNKAEFDLLAGGVPTAPAITNVIDDVGVITGNVQPYGFTDDNLPTIIGTAPAGQMVTVYVDGMAVGSVVSAANGQWSFTPTVALNEGLNEISVSATDANGNVSPTSGAYPIIVDTIAPVIGNAQLNDDVGQVQGPIVNGSVTDDATPTLTGQGELGATIIIYDNGIEIGRVPVDAQGDWSFTPAPALPDGEHSFSHQVQDRAGNQSPISTPIDFVVDTTGVAVSIDYAIDDAGSITGNLATGAATDDTTPTLVGKATARSVVEIFQDGFSIGSVVANARGEWSFTPDIALEEGVHAFTVTATNAAQQTVTSSEFSLEIDLTPPVNDGISYVGDDVGAIQGPVGNGEVTDDSTPSIGGSNLTPGDVVTIINDGKIVGTTVVDPVGNWEFKPETPLNDGEHEFTIIVTDPVGNSSEESDPYLVIVETVAPSQPTIDRLIDDQGNVTGPIAPGSTTDDSQPEIIGSATPGSIVVIYNDGLRIGSTIADDQGNWSYTPERPMKNGPNEIVAREQSAAGSLSDPTPPFNLVVQAGGVPAAPAITGVIDDVGVITGNVQPNGVTDDTRPTVQGTANPGNIISVYADGVLLGTTQTLADGTWSFTPTTDLPPGLVNLTAKSTDVVGAESPETGEYPINIDITPPGGISGESLFDDVGVTGPIVSGDSTDDSTPTFSGKAEPGATVIIKDDGKEIGRVPVDANGDWSFTPATPLPEGDHSFSAIVQDPAGNQSAESTPIDFVVDTSAVDISITHARDDVGSITGNLSSGAVTDDTRPVLVGKATPNMLVTIYQDGSAVGSVTADGLGRWSFEVPTLTEGNYQFAATITDVNGVESAQTTVFELEIDLTAPQKPVIEDVTDDVGSKQGTIANGGYTDDSTPTLRGSGQQPGDVVTVRENGQLIGSALVDAQGEWSLTPETPLNDGRHEFTVVATDAAGNTSVSSDPWAVIVDTVAPVTPVISTVWDDHGSVTGNISNGGVTDDQTPTLRGTAEPNSTVSIYDGNNKLADVTADQNGNWSYTTETMSYGTSHSFTAVATDAAGNVSGSSAQYVVGIALPVSTAYINQSGMAPGSGGYASYSMNGITLTSVNQNGVEAPGYVLTRNNLGQVIMAGDPGQQLKSSIMKVSFGPLGASSFSMDIGGTEWSVTMTWKVYDINNNLIDTFTRPGSRGATNYTADPGIAIGHILVESGGRSWTSFRSGSAELYQEPIAVRSTSEIEAQDDSSLAAAINEEDSNSHHQQPEIKVNETTHTLTVEHAEQPIDLSSLAENMVNSTVVDMTNDEQNVLIINLADVLAYGEEHAFTGDDTKQLMIKGDAGDVVNLTDLLPDGTDPGDWAKAEGTVTVGGVQFEVYQHAGAETELLVQMGVQTNLNNH
ncbi:Ig-like domain-containing protein, partial [Enterobacter sp. CFBP8995]|nr:Ig-like domain-containing protein [Enterobacter sp. CFBP8995]